MKDQQGKEHECKAKGTFRNEGITPIPGDFVEFEPAGEQSYGLIQQVLERKNQLVRPAVANVDCAIIVIAPTPKPDLLLVDKLILYATQQGIAPILVLNKMDLDKKHNLQALEEEYQKVLPVYQVCAKDGSGIPALLLALQGKVVCFAGQSAVGKSSLINGIAPELGLETGGLSKKTQRGRHTTRHAQLYEAKEAGVTLVDTPGFSILATLDCEPEDLASYYEDFAPYLGKCRFATCMHNKEPDCAVKQGVEEGNISPGRYARYLELLQELIEKRSKRYD